jgi:hypothetical protein
LKDALRRGAPPENTTRARWVTDAGRGHTTIATSVCGRLATSPSLYQMVPRQERRPVRVSEAIQWTRDEVPRRTVPLAVIWGSWPSTSSRSSSDESRRGQGGATAASLAVSPSSPSTGSSGSSSSSRSRSCSTTGRVRGSAGWRRAYSPLKRMRRGSGSRGTPGPPAAS